MLVVGKWFGVGIRLWMLCFCLECLTGLISVKPNEHSNFVQIMRQYTSSLNFLSLNIPEEIDTFSEEFDIYQGHRRHLYACDFLDKY